MCATSSKLPKMSTADSRQKAVAALAVFGDSWNKKGLIPRAPASMDDEDEYCLTWARWYTVVTGRAPLDKEHR